MTPKIMAALGLIEQVLIRREQVVVFACFHDPLDVLTSYLNDAGVPVKAMDGRQTQKARGRISAEFKQRRYAALICGVESCAEAHSWPLANNVILLAYSWAFDKLSQAIDRCHRLNSVKDLNYYALLCEGTVDLVLENNLQEKNDTSDLVLDGQLLETNPREVSLAEILSTAAADFNPESKTIDETDLELEWPALRERLRTAARRWQVGEAGEKRGKGAEEKKRELPAPLLLCPSAPLLPAHPWAARLQRRQLALA
jgi:superfamily II DNA or RNA helicase